MTCPCKDCEFRRPACHGKCEVYKKWRSPVDVMREDKARQRMIDETLTDGTTRRIRAIRNGKKR